LSKERRFDALSGFGMDAVVVEILQFALGGWPPGLEKVAVAKGDAKYAFSTDDLYWQRVKKFVAEDDQRGLQRRARTRGGVRRSTARLDVLRPEFSSPLRMVNPGNIPINLGLRRF
jgi:hypothetical protein